MTSKSPARVGRSSSAVATKKVRLEWVEGGFGLALAMEIMVGEMSVAR